jgi:hypothetical protein
MKAKGQAQEGKAKQSNEQVEEQRPNHQNQKGKNNAKEQRNNHPPTPPYHGTFAYRPHRLYLPSTLDKLLVGLVGRNSRHLDHYRWVISSIIYLRVTDKRFVRDSFIPLNQEVLRAIISKRKLTGILADLCKWGFIEQNRSWLAGRYSMSYRLMKPFRADKVKALLLTDKGMNKRLALFQWSREILANAAGLGYACVRRWLDHLRIDRGRAMRFIRRAYPLHSEKYEARFIGIDLIANGGFFFSVDDKAGRAHHNLSNLAADIRPFVTLNDQPLVQVDISNSQPLFLYLTLSSSQNIDSSESDYMRELVTTGTFYDVLKPQEMERDQFKREIFQVFYGRGKFITPITTLFNDQFPSYAAEIARAKVPDHARLAIAMQAEEAKLIFKAVERFAFTTHYTVPILTIHDSLVTTPEYIALAEHTLHEVFQEVHGIVPPTKIKPEHYATTVAPLAEQHRA